MGSIIHFLSFDTVLKKVLIVIVFNLFILDGFIVSAFLCKRKVGREDTKDDVRNLNLSKLDGCVSYFQGKIWHIIFLISS